MGSGQDVLDEFVSLRPAAEPPREIRQHYELVVRSSGGGTGIYTEVEDHYRIFYNELRNVLQFVSRHYGSYPTGPRPSTTPETRWFTTDPMANGLPAKSH